MALPWTTRLQKALEEALRELGYIPGRQTSIEYRFAGGDAERLRQFASELVQLPVDVIITDTNPAVAAAKQATNTIPIVMANPANSVSKGTGSDFNASKVLGFSKS